MRCSSLFRMQSSDWLEMGESLGNKGEGLNRWTFTLLEEDGDKLSRQVP